MSESVSESTDRSAFAAALRLGSSELARGCTSEAQQQARVALKLRPGNPQAQHLMGRAFFRERQYGLAFEIFAKLSERHSESAALHVNAGLAALYSGEHVEEALTHLQLAIGLSPGHRRAFAHLGLLHLEAGDLELARAAFAEASLERLRGEVEAGVDREALAQRVREALAELPPVEADDEAAFAEVGAIAAQSEPLEFEAEPGDGEDREGPESEPTGHHSMSSLKPANSLPRSKLRALTREGREPLADRRAGGRRRMVSGEINTGAGDAGAKSKKRLPGVISGEIASIQNEPKTAAGPASSSRKERVQRPTVEVLLEEEESDPRETPSSADTSEVIPVVEDEAAEISVVEDEPPRPTDELVEVAVRPPNDELDFSSVGFADEQEDEDTAGGAGPDDRPALDDGPTLDEAIGAARPDGDERSLRATRGADDDASRDVEEALDAQTFEAGLPVGDEPAPPGLTPAPLASRVATEDPHLAVARAARAAEIRAACEVAVAPLKSADLSRHTLSQPLLPALTAGERVELRRGRLYLRFGAWCKNGGRWTAIVRDDCMVLAQGQIQSAVARRRLHGAEAEPFVVGGHAFLRLSGDGLSIAEPGEGATFDLFWLGAAQVFYLREDLLYAYSGTLHWENGHLPGDGGAAMIRLCGEGVVVADGPGLACCPVREQAPVVVGTQVLAGWLGDVVVFPTSKGADGGVRDGYSCSGKGTLLLRGGAR